MTITTTRAERQARRAFTLVELLVALTLSGFLLTAVLGTTLYLIRSGMEVAQYAEMDAQIRRAVDRFGNDVKVATDITWNGSSDITLTLPDASGGSSTLTYAWDAASRALYVVPGGSSAASTGRLYLITDVGTSPDGGAGVSFVRHDRTGAVATTDAATKRIQIRITVLRHANPALPPVSSSGAATFILRNKVSS